MHPADGVAFAVDMTDETVPVGQFLQASRSDGTAYGTMSQLPGAGYRDAGGGAMRLGVLSNGFWSSTAVGASQSSRLIFNFGSMTPDDHLAMNDNAMPIRCVPVQSTDTPPSGASGAEILYIDDDGLLQIGHWDTPNNTAAGAYGKPLNSLDQLVYFKFGSVVGVLVRNHGVFELDQIAFSPRTTYNGNAIGSYADIPRYVYGDDRGFAGEGQDLPDAYHRPHLGKGDPCRLVGLSTAAARAMTDERLMNYDSGWRMPTSKQSVAFIGSGSNYIARGNWVNGTYDNNANMGIGVFPGSNNVELPAVGSRIHDSGAVVSTGFDGPFWLSTVRDQENGLMLYFSARRVLSSTFHGMSNSDGVRCVPK